MKSQAFLLFELLKNQGFTLLSERQSILSASSCPERKHMSTAYHRSVTLSLTRIAISLNLLSKCWATCRISIRSCVPISRGYLETLHSSELVLIAYRTRIHRSKSSYQLISKYRYSSKKSENVYKEHEKHDNSCEETDNWANYFAIVDYLLKTYTSCWEDPPIEENTFFCIHSFFAFH